MHLQKHLYLLLVVGDDAADKVRVSVPECGHEVTQLLFVQLANSTEHALAGLEGTVHRVRHSRYLVQADDTVHCAERERQQDTRIRVQP